MKRRKRRKPRPSRARPKPRRGSLGLTAKGTVRVRNYTPRGQKPARSQADVMRSREAIGRDIGKCLSPLDPARYAACRLDLERFLRVYMPGRFFAPFSEDHRRVIRKTEQAILEGGLFAEAVFRGFGKTEILIGATVWATLYGHRRFVPLLAATADLAQERLVGGIKVELESSALLFEDFEAVCRPARALEGLTHRCPGQLSNGTPTRIGWSMDTLSLPVVDVFDRRDPAKLIGPAVSAGIVIRAFGLTAGFRGLAHTTAGGETLRPEFVAIDDPQTDESAASPSQCEKRERLVTRTVLGLGGHFQKLAGVMCATIVRKGDMADRLLDRTIHPEWQGDVLPMVKTWAARHEDLWLKRYAELRRADLLEEQGGRKAAEAEATAFYQANRAEMDAGAAVSWEHCFERGELSAIQHAYNLLIDKGEAAFMAEYQNQPLDEANLGDEPPIEPRDVLAKCVRLPRRVCPHGSSVVVAFIDCRKPELHWLVCAFGAGFRGHVVEVGLRQYLGAGARALGGVSGALTTALGALTAQLAQASWALETGTDLRTGLILVDSGWQSRPIYACLRRSPFAALLVPSKGEGGERDLTVPKALHVPGRDRGDQWYYALNRERDARLLTYNVDHWKSFVAERIRTPVGGRGSLTLFGDPADRAMWPLAEQLTAERPRTKQRRTGDPFDKWAALPGRPNHWWDCLVGCHVGAARLGIALDGPAVGAAGLAATAGYRFRTATRAPQESAPAASQPQAGEQSQGGYRFGRAKHGPSAGRT